MPIALMPRSSLEDLVASAEPATGSLEEIVSGATVPTASLEDLVAGAQVPPTGLRRLGANIGAGVLGVASGLAGAAQMGRSVLGLPGERSIQSAIDSIDALARSLSPADAGFGDKLVQGIASSATLFVPGLGAAGLAGRLLGVSARAAPRLARLIGASTEAVAETLVEGGGSYVRAKQEGKSEQEAQRIATETLGGNLGLLTATNLVANPFFIRRGQRLLGLLKTAGMEGVEEAGQAIIEPLARREAPKPGEVAESAALGATVGTLFGGVGALRPLPGRPDVSPAPGAPPPAPEPTEPGAPPPGRPAYLWVNEEGHPLHPGHYRSPEEARQALQDMLDRMPPGTQINLDAFALIQRTEPGWTPAEWPLTATPEVSSPTEVLEGREPPDRSFRLRDPTETEGVQPSVLPERPRPREPWPERPPPVLVPPAEAFGGREPPERVFRLRGQTETEGVQPSVLPERPRPTEPWPERLPPAPAVFAGWQENLPGRPPIPLFTLTADVPGTDLVQGSTVDHTALLESGLAPPATEAAPPAPVVSVATVTRDASGQIVLRAPLPPAPPTTRRLRGRPPAVSLDPETTAELERMRIAINQGAPGRRLFITPGETEGRGYDPTIIGAPSTYPGWMSTIAGDANSAQAAIRAAQAGQTTAGAVRAVEVARANLEQARQIEARELAAMPKEGEWWLTPAGPGEVILVNRAERRAALRAEDGTITVVPFDQIERDVAAEFAVPEEDITTSAEGEVLPMRGRRERHEGPARPITEQAREYRARLNDAVRGPSPSVVIDTTQPGLDPTVLADIGAHPDVQAMNGHVARAFRTIQRALGPHVARSRFVGFALDPSALAFVVLPKFSGFRHGHVFLNLHDLAAGTRKWLTARNTLSPTSEATWTAAEITHAITHELAHEIVPSDGAAHQKVVRGMLQAAAPEIETSLLRLARALEAQDGRILNTLAEQFALVEPSLASRASLFGPAPDVSPAGTPLPGSDPGRLAGRPGTRPRSPPDLRGRPGHPSEAPGVARATRLRGRGAAGDEPQGPSPEASRRLEPTEHVQGPVYRVDPKTGERTLIWSPPATFNELLAEINAAEVRSRPRQRPAAPPEPSGVTPAPAAEEIGAPGFRYEETPLGLQAMIPGTERRVMAPGPIRQRPGAPRLESAESDLNLFNEEAKARQDALAESQIDFTKEPTPPTPEPAFGAPSRTQLLDIAEGISLANVPEGLRRVVRQGVAQLRQSSGSSLTAEWPVPAAIGDRLGGLLRKAGGTVGGAGITLNTPIGPITLIGASGAGRTVSLSLLSDRVASAGGWSRQGDRWMPPPAQAELDMAPGVPRVTGELGRWLATPLKASPELKSTVRDLQRSIFDDESGRIHLGQLGAMIGEAVRTIKTHAGTELERYQALRGEQKGREAYRLKQGFEIRRDSGEVDIRIEVARALAHPSVWSSLSRLPYVGERGAAVLTNLGRRLLPESLASQFGVTTAEQPLLFRAAEAILRLDPNGQPVFGTRRFYHDRTGLPIIDPVTGQPKWDWRARPAQGQALWNQLSDQGQAAVRWWVGHRELTKTTYGVVGDIEGYMHHFFERGLVDSFRRILLAKKRASPRRLRTESLGYVEDFERSILKGLRDLSHEAHWNAFIPKFAQLITDPIDHALGIKDGYREIPRLRATRGPHTVGQLAGGRQIPAPLYDEFVRLVEGPEEVLAVAELGRSLVRFVKANLLTRPGTMVRNAISGGLQYGNKIIEDLNRGVLTGEFRPLMGDLIATVEALTPVAIEQVPAEIWRGGRSGLLSELRGRTVRQAGPISGLTAHAIDRIDRLDRLMLWHYGAIENYWKRVIALSELHARRLPIDRDALLKNDQALAEINEAIDTFAFDYENVPNAIRRARLSGVATGLVLYPTYPYKLFRLYGRYFGALVGAGDLTPQERLVRIMTLGTLASLVTLAFQGGPDRDRWPGIPYSVDTLGRIFVGTTPEGKERWLKTQPYPWLNLMEAINSGGDLVARIGQEGPGAMISESTLAEARSLAGEIVSEGPLIEFYDMLAGKGTAGEVYQPSAARWGEFLRLFVPFSPVSEGLRQTAGGVRTVPTTFGQSIGRVLPVPGEWLGLEPGKIQRDQITKKPIIMKPEIEQLKFWLGINLLEVDPRHYRVARATEIVNALDAAMRATEVSAFDRAVTRLREVDPARFAHLRTRLGQHRIILTQRQAALIDRLETPPREDESDE